MSVQVLRSPLTPLQVRALLAVLAAGRSCAFALSWQLL